MIRQFGMMSAMMGMMIGWTSLAAAQDAVAPASPDMMTLPEDAMMMASPEDGGQPLEGQQLVNFPQLPPSRPCVKGDLVGIWQLYQVHEEPAGNDLAGFSTSPVQYMLFERENVYGKYNSGNTPLSIKEIREQVEKSKSGVQQFVVHESGIIFFYRDGASVDSQACFIVANRLGNFTVGQMLLMPPAGQSSTRLVKVYNKISSPAPVEKPPVTKATSTKPKPTGTTTKKPTPPKSTPSSKKPDNSKQQQNTNKRK